MKKSLILSVVLISVFALFFVITPGKTRNKSYYSGDAIAYNNQVYISTTNTGSLEIFKLDGSNLNSISKTKPFNARFNSYDEFYDSKLAAENDRLYVYAVSNYTIYKYEVSSNKLIEIKKSSNTYWEWYNRIDIFGSDIVTVSAKGVKIFNSNLDVIIAHDFGNLEAPYNVSGNDKYFLSVNESANKLEIYDKESRKVITSISLNFKHDKGNRRAYQNQNGIYVVDDYYAKKFDLDGNLLGSFKHLDYQGFDVAGSDLTEYIYFSNGVGLVKLDKNMVEKDYAFTGNMGGKGGWAMGLKVVYANGEKVVLFNGTNILVMDSNLNKIAAVSSYEEENQYPLENLYLRTDVNQAAQNSSVVLSGGGFLPNEELKITMHNQLNTLTADNRGRFSTILKVPSDAKKGGQDIKVEGQESKLHYSISFTVL